MQWLQKQYGNYKYFTVVNYIHTSIDLKQKNKADVQNNAALILFLFTSDTILIFKP